MTNDFDALQSARCVLAANVVLSSAEAKTNNPAVLRKCLFSALVALEPETAFVKSDFATELRDYEKHISVSSGGDVADSATYGDFHHMVRVCEENGSHVAIVIDAEGSYVCLAPVAVAQLIAQILDASKEFAEDAYRGNGGDE